jgi:uncharacterized membrane-anchored protein YitT (DUF2179 family)
LKKKGYGVSVIETSDKKKMLLIEIDKRKLNDVKKIILSMDKNAFMIFNDTKVVQNGYLK